MRVSEKYSSATFIKVYIKHRMTSFQMLYIVTLAYIFKVTQFLEIYIVISGKR